MNQNDNNFQSVLKMGPVNLMASADQLCLSTLTSLAR